jgi:hypothetical protein
MQSRYNGKRIEIRFPTEEEKEKLEAEAKAKGCTVAKYVLSILDESRQKPRPISRAGDFHALQQENHRLAQDLRAKDLLLSQQEAELRKLRGAAFLQPSGEAKIDPDLIHALQAGPIHDHRLLVALGAADSESISAISRQLQILEKMGAIQKTALGWSWKK